MSYNIIKQLKKILQLLLPRGQFPNLLREKNYQTNNLIKQRFSEQQLFSVIDMERDTKLIGKNRFT